MAPRPVDRLSLAQARRVALVAQGFTSASRRRATDRRRPPSARALLALVDRLGAVQVDSVNVLCRAHYLPHFSRLGPYARTALDLATSVAPVRLTEYWAHEASLVTPSTHRLLRWRMARWREDASHRVQWAAGYPQVVREVRTVVADQGPLTATQVEEALPDMGPSERRSWWNGRSPVRKALELLFHAGEVTSAGRTPQFERRYALPEHVLPPEILALPDPDEEESFTELVAAAARACGVGTERDLRDYFRLPLAAARTGIDALARRGELLPVTVEGVRQQAWLHRDARIPQRVDACALLAPFDPLVWQRQRTEELFGFRYRIEIYVPATRRIHGYYVLPFLLGDSLVARVDLKANRAAGALLVRGAFEEPWAPPETTKRLAEELHTMAGWLGLGSVTVTGEGDVPARLRAWL